MANTDWCCNRKHFTFWNCLRHIWQKELISRFPYSPQSYCRSQWDLAGVLPSGHSFRGPQNVLCCIPGTEQWWMAFPLLPVLHCPAVWNGSRRNKRRGTEIRNCLFASLAVTITLVWSRATITSMSTTPVQPHFSDISVPFVKRRAVVISIPPSDSS